jgi:hypothetical protein
VGSSDRGFEARRATVFPPPAEHTLSPSFLRVVDRAQVHIKGSQPPRPTFAERIDIGPDTQAFTEKNGPVEWKEKSVLTVLTSFAISVAGGVLDARLTPHCLRRTVPT